MKRFSASGSELKIFLLFLKAIPSTMRQMWQISFEFWVKLYITMDKVDKYGVYTLSFSK